MRTSSWIVMVLFTLTLGEPWDDTGNTDDDLPFDNVHSIESVLNPFSTHGADVNESPPKQDIAVAEAFDEENHSGNARAFNGSTKLRDDISASMEKPSFSEPEDALAFKLLDESVELIINETESENELVEFFILNATGAPTIESYDDVNEQSGACKLRDMVANSFLIAYGSQTGQAESIARQIFDYCNAIDLSPRLHTLDQNEKEFNLENESFAIIVISSTGDGDPPENAARFMRRICRKTLSADFLAHTSFALLGLGDSNYSTYQGIPKKLEKQLLSLGAKSLIERGEADDQVGLELVVEPWLDKLYALLEKLFKTSKQQDADLSTVQFANREVEVEVAQNQENGSDRIVPAIPMLRVEKLEFPEKGPCLIRGGDDLRLNDNLKVSATPASFLISSVTHGRLEESAFVWQNGSRFPGIGGSVQPARVISTRELTDFDVRKPKMEITIDLGRDAASDFYSPGDAFYFIVQNPVEEVNYILKRIGVLDIADQTLNISVDKNTKKMAASVPNFVPQKCTFRYLFTHCLDIRKSPSRALIRVLANSAKDESEKRRLLELVSTQGVHEFTEHVRQANISLCDLLLAFPSSSPEPDRLIELLPRLMPRPYSVASFNGQSRNKVSFVYSLMTFALGEGRQYERRGLATDWLNSLRVGDTVEVIHQKPTAFRISESSQDIFDQNVLMIGPGTGIAPFISFLQKLRFLTRQRKSPNLLKLSTRHLFFGCRDVQRDGLYIEELHDYKYEGLLDEYVVCESRPREQNGSPKYVQDALKIHSKMVYSFLTEGKGVVYVCGDASGMSKDIWKCFIEIVHNEDQDMSLEEATAFMLDIRKNGRYKEDVWS